MKRTGLTTFLAFALGLAVSCGPPPRVADVNVETQPNVGYDQIYIPGGDFMMGSSEKEVEAARKVCDDERKTCPWSLFNNEMPQRSIQLSAYFIDKYETTVAEYRTCVDAKICEVPVTTPYCTWGISDAENHPINCVNWHQAKNYCEWAGKRLPTEAEWERAARGTDGRIFPWGDLHPSQQSEKVGNFSGVSGNTENRTWGLVKDYDDGFVGTSPVGTFRAGLSPTGAADMAGNVAEWVEDRYSVSGYDEKDVDDPLGASQGTGRVARGGSFSVDSVEIRTTARYAGAPLGPYNILGFRCAQTAD